MAPYPWFMVLVIVVWLVGGMGVCVPVFLIIMYGEQRQWPVWATAPLAVLYLAVAIATATWVWQSFIGA